MEESLGTDLQAASCRLLTDALERVLQHVCDAEAVRSFVDANSATFMSYIPGGEHKLEWTSIHHEYCRLVEGALQTELQVLGCPEAALLDHAMQADPLADKLLTRLLAKTDYTHFCEMMRAEAVSCGDDGDFEAVDEAPHEEDAEDDEDLATLEHAVLTRAMQEFSPPLR